MLCISNLERSQKLTIFNIQYYNLLFIVCAYVYKAHVFSLLIVDAFILALDHKHFAGYKNILPQDITYNLPFHAMQMIDNVLPQNSPCFLNV